MRHIPTSLYIDTQIFMGENLRFDTRRFLAIKKTFLPKGLRLLIPEIMERELLRHFNRRSEEAADQILKAHKTYPADRLALFELLPPQEKIKAQCLEVMIQQWTEFKNHFVVETLPVVGKLTDVVDWYFDIILPFTEKKPKEFPDALIVSALDDYHDKNHANIAVISADNGFKEACKRRRYFHDFNDLEEYAEAFQPELSEDERLPGDIDPTRSITTEDLTELKAILARGNQVTPIEIDRTMKLLEGKGPNYEYFFQNADDTVWLHHLSDKGLFANPPNARTTEGNIYSPWWPPLDYLIRIFDVAPSEVMDIISKFPDTNNFRILKGIYQIVLKADSADAVSRFSRFINAYIDNIQ